MVQGSFTIINILILLTTCRSNYYIRFSLDYGENYNNIFLVRFRRNVKFTFVLKYTGSCLGNVHQRKQIYICEWCARKWLCKNIFTQKVRHLIKINF